MSEFRAFSLPRPVIVASESQNNEYRTDMFEHKHKTAALVDEASSSNVKTSQINAAKFKQIIGEHAVIKSKYKSKNISTQSHLTLFLASNSMVINDMDEAAASRLIVHVPRYSTRPNLRGDFYTIIPIDERVTELVAAPHIGDYFATMLGRWAPFPLNYAQCLSIDKVARNIRLDTEKMYDVARGDRPQLDMFKNVESVDHSGVLKENLQTELAAAVMLEKGTTLNVSQFITMNHYLMKLREIECAKIRLNQLVYSNTTKRTQMGTWRRNGVFDAGGHYKEVSKSNKKYIRVVKVKKGIFNVK